MKSISSEKCSNSTSLYPYRAKSCLIYFCCYIFSPMSMGFLSFFHAYFKHISACFSSTKPDFDDTSPHFMILWWYFSLHFLEKFHSAKVLNINDIILYFGWRMILWDFFREKNFFCVSALVFFLFYNFLLKECDAIPYQVWLLLVSILNNIPQLARVSRLGIISNFRR